MIEFLVLVIKYLLIIAHYENDFKNTNMKILIDKLMFGFCFVQVKRTRLGFLFWWLRLEHWGLDSDSSYGDLITTLAGVSEAPVEHRAIDRLCFPRLCPSNSLSLCLIGQAVNVLLAGWTGGFGVWWAAWLSVCVNLAGWLSSLYRRLWLWSSQCVRALYTVSLHRHQLRGLSNITQSNCWQISTCYGQIWM